MQVKLDEYLAFIKIYRNYRRGDFFKNIKRNILSSSKLTIEMEQFRQILTIDPQMYVYSRELYFSYGYDILVGLPPRFDLAARKASFKLKMK